MVTLVRLTVMLMLPICCMLSGYSQAKDTNDFDLSGYIMLDYDRFDSAFLEDSDESDSSSEIRRARLKLKYALNDNWNAKFQIGLSDSDIDVKDAYVQYKGWSIADITLGQQKEPFGLEKLTSSRNLFMIERSMSTSAFSPGRSLGISLSGKLPSLYWQVGYYQPDDDETTSAVTGRIAWLPWQNKDNLLHLGLAFSERAYDGNEFRINEKLEVYSSDSLIEGDELSADKTSLQSAELLWIQDRYTVMAEWQHAAVTGNDLVTHDYEGGYVQLSYQLSGGHRKYKDGVLGSRSKNGWEITSRYSTLLLTNEFKDAETYAIGLNYNFNKNLKFMGDYIHSNRFDDGVKLDSGNAISLRMQYAF